MTINHVLWLPFPRPPLTANQRHAHWAQRHKPEQTIQRAVFIAVKQQWPGVKFSGPVDIRLEYYPGDNRARDSDNIFPTLKPIIDGLRHAGVLADDHGAYVRATETMIVRKADDPSPTGAGPELVLCVTEGREILGRPPR